jgi:hypothetical protein
MKITNDMKKIAANRKTKKEFNEFTKDINMSNISDNKIIE